MTVSKFFNDTLPSEDCTIQSQKAAILVSAFFLKTSQQVSFLSSISQSCQPWWLKLCSPKILEDSFAMRVRQTQFQGISPSEMRERKGSNPFLVKRSKHGTDCNDLSLSGLSLYTYRALCLSCGAIRQTIWLYERITNTLWPVITNIEDIANQISSGQILALVWKST